MFIIWSWWDWGNLNEKDVFNVGKIKPYYHFLVNGHNYGYNLHWHNMRWFLYEIKLTCQCLPMVFRRNISDISLNCDMILYSHITCFTCKILRNHLFTISSKITNIQVYVWSWEIKFLLRAVDLSHFTNP